MTTDRRAGSDDVTRLPLYILAGGKSRRFGSNKARALRGNVPLIVSVADCLAPLASSVTVVAAVADEYQDLGLRTIGDVVPDRGPLGGLLTAVQDLSRPGWLILVACDWVGIRVEWVQQLLSARHDGVVAAVFKADRFEPLLGLYHSAIVPLVAAGIEREDLSMQSLLAEASVEVVAAPVDWRRAINLNRLPDNGVQDCEKFLDAPDKSS